MVLFKHLELDTNTPCSPEVKVVVEKQPIVIEEGKSYANFSVLIDKETEKVHNLVLQAEAIKNLPEHERPAAILNLLRDNIQYAHKDVLEKVSETDPELAQWVAKNTGLNSFSTMNVPLSELVEKGYGVCRHLSVAYLYLAEKAGLEGCFMNSDSGTIKNIERTDTKEKLFKSTEIGKPVSPHSWIEIKLSNGQWIPVDPSTKLVGDSPEKLEMFRQANYLAIGYGIDIEGEPHELWAEGKGLTFKPGESRTEGAYHLFLKSTRPSYKISKGQSEIVPPTNTPFSGEGKINIITGDQFYGMKLKLVDVEIA